MGATAEEGRDEIFGTYRAAAAHADHTIRSLDLDSPGHADILREQLDGRTGMRPAHTTQEPHDEQWWSDYRARIEAAARAAG